MSSSGKGHLDVVGRTKKGTECNEMRNLSLNVIVVTTGRVSDKSQTQ